MSDKKINKTGDMIFNDGNDKLLHEDDSNIDGNAHESNTT